MPTSSVLIGSHPSIPATTVQVTANASTENLSFPAGSYYLYHSTGSLSASTAFATMLNTHTQLVGSSCFVTLSGKTRATNSTAFSIDSWGSDTTLRDFFGWTSTTGSSTGHTSNSQSPAIWIPGKPESSTARLGSDGLLTKDTQVGRSAPGMVVATTNNTWRTNGFRWEFVHIDRVEQVPDVNGTWAIFWDEVVSKFRRFNLWRNVTEDDTDDTTQMTLSTMIPSSGTYIASAAELNGSAMVREHDRQIERLEIYSRITLGVETALEYGA